jgi:hypothetical protein
MGPNFLKKTYHVPILQLKLTRNLEELMPCIREEMVVAFEEVLSLRGDGVCLSASLNMARLAHLRQSGPGSTTPSTVGHSVLCVPSSLSHSTPTRHLCLAYIHFDGILYLTFRQGFVRSIS